MADRDFPRNDLEAPSKPLVQSSISDENQKSELKPPEVLFESSKVVALDDRKHIGNNANSNNSNGAPKPHQVEREGNCYCGKDRNLNIVELLCAICFRWYHESCIGYQLGKLVPFMMNYFFVCKNCSPTGLESFKKNQAPFPQMCVTALGNLMQASVKEGSPRTMFSKERDIIPFIDSHWEGMTTMPRRVTQSWHSTINRALTKDVGTLFICEEDSSDGGQPLFGLLAADLTHIKPNYEAMIRGGHLKVTDMGIQHGGVKGRSTKRKLPGGDQGQGAGKKGRGGGEAAAPKLPAHGYPLEHPYNKDGYRYILAEPDPHAPFRQEFDESSDWAGKPIPGWLYRTLSPSSVLLALHDRAPQLRISEDRLAVTGDKGYCMVRATHAVSRGSWYWEATIEEMPESSATRLGWAQEYANLQAPLGYDKFGYSWRSRKGTRFHECRGKHYSSGYGEGDTLGFLIILPESPEINYIPHTYKDRPLVKFKSHLYYEEKDRVTESLKALKVLSGSKLIFFKNGACQGVAFSDIYGGHYFPTLSIHKSATVSVNFGPNFKYSPSNMSFRGMYEKAEEAICEQTMADLLYLTENEGKLRLDTYCM
ncbi:Set1/Ash2 histone methyltransferase complex subunit ASH2 [Cryptotermes secundus]|uniref:Set1/Ash2 histone methyltransferase complex subunit ASH2 n=1 Tax=Cryptotermes secundus TaxID=105785 RepID=A0A2J7QW12_9NEOP|nr:set1/Ash2 histone methyltransferase complex subunit ASH2 [Cryptotermes secundus]PNF32762.1 Set1/Ash2 histone methyltransferase complex subunit ASH2 [Cryptotermes secundus]PNF32763.1 Set1/Ash2 histone methyltransferase complex subunit ASH2 [Cryptotermes secundus]PNF32764.1 Set1/Ash2 histone methyltransferase complex subunit ASH2 [Cryptotermes secundus]